MEEPPFLEFGFCGLDYSIPDEVLQEVFAPAEGEAGGVVRLVAAYNIAYQGYPWEPTPAYAEGAPLEGRRCKGLVYPSWTEIDAFQFQLPEGTPVAFHLSETPACPYVSKLLRCDVDALRLVNVLVEEYGACRVQIDLAADGVPEAVFARPDAAGASAFEAVNAATVIRQLCVDYPGTVFVVPLAKLTRPDGVSIDTLPFFERLLAVEPVPPNLCGFFDASAGSGVAPENAPEIPEAYPRRTRPRQRAGYAGGIDAESAKVWLDRYAACARQRGCSLIVDEHSGFRRGGRRGAPVDADAVRALAAAVREWAGEQSAEREDIHPIPGFGRGETSASTPSP